MWAAECPFRKISSWVRLFVLCSRTRANGRMLKVVPFANIVEVRYYVDVPMKLIIALEKYRIFRDNDRSRMVIVSATAFLSMFSVPTNAPNESRTREIFPPVVFFASAITVSVSVSIFVAVAVVVQSAGWYEYDMLVSSTSSILRALTQRPSWCSVCKQVFQ